MRFVRAALRAAMVISTFCGVLWSATPVAAEAKPPVCERSLTIGGWTMTTRFAVPDPLDWFADSATMAHVIRGKTQIVIGRGNRRKRRGFVIEADLYAVNLNFEILAQHGYSFRSGRPRYRGRWLPYDSLSVQINVDGQIVRAGLLGTNWKVRLGLPDDMRGERIEIAVVRRGVGKVARVDLDGTNLFSGLRAKARSEGLRLLLEESEGKCRVKK
ncbi:MAG: hypothetical protein AAFR04_06135 [Pseudomonadota bacterium]